MLNLTNYQVLAQIYESINSEVYRAIRDTDNQRVILKFLKEDYPTPSEITRYKQEYEITRNLNLDGVIKAYELKPYQQTLVMILEDFGAVSLKDLINQRREAGADVLPLEEFFSIAIKTAEILGLIHAKNIVHKDINPANIIFNPETGQLKIIDFGISTQFTSENPTVKNPNILEGTLAYISPEQTGRMNRSLDYRTDFYSLGVTFYELLTGQLPFETNDPLELVHFHIAKVPLSPHQINPEIPKAVSDIIMKLMAKTAEERYQSAFGIKNDLAQCWHQLQTTGNIIDFPLGSQDIAEHFQIPQKLYGREAEVETLLTAFERVANPEKSQIEMMLVAGYSGIGKSSLVAEIHKPNTRLRGYFTEGKFDQFQKSIPYSAVVNAFKGLVRQLLTESEAQLQQWRGKLSSAFGINGQVIIDVIPEVEMIVGSQPPVPELGASESQNRFNIVFGNFIRAFGTKEHPLVIFLDDLQWADSATLKLIELMMTDTDMEYLFLIGAYRDNEVSPSHPLIVTLDGLLKGGATINYITLAPLALENINQIIADTLYSDRDSVKSLAELVMSKTGGNPFFVNQFMKTLHAENLIILDLDRHNWQWNIDQIESKNMTDNVVELMIINLKKLPEITQQILCLASCIGSSFCLITLSIVCGKPKEVIFSDLVVAVQSGLILATSELDQNLLIEDYKFLHDRVQQAAYLLIPNDQKQVTHFKIGQLLLQNYSEIEREEKLFDLVGHLNLGQELIAEANEREALAKLNLKAGQKARNSNAYAAANIYLQMGIKLLTVNSWKNQYKLTLNLYVVATEVAYLNADLEGMEKMARQVLQNAHVILDKVKIYEIKIAAQTAKANPLAAIAVAREALSQLGVDLPIEPDEITINKGLKTLNNQLQGRQISQLLDLPVMTDSQTESSMKLLSMLIAASVQGMPSLLPVVGLTMVSLSLKFGNTSASSVGYVLYGMVRCTVLGDVETGYEFGKLALNVLNRFNAMEFKSIIMLMFGCFIQHRQEPLRAAIQTLKDGYMAGGETGEALYAGYSIEHYSYASFFSGIELGNLAAELAAYSDALLQLKQYSARNYLDLLRQTIQNFRDFVGEPDCLKGTAYDETVMLPKHHQDNDLCAIVYVYIYKFLLAYLWENYISALEHMIEIEKYVYSMTLGSVFIPVFHFYAALAQLALFPNSTEQDDIISKVEIHKTKLYCWMQNALGNHQHKWYLIEAEKNRILGNKIEAIEYYDRAISLAKENQFIQEEALASELAAKFYLEWGKEKIAKTYIMEAYYCYLKWGATAKIRDLETRYRQLLKGISPGTKNIKNTEIGTFSGSDSHLDMTTVTKAYQVISSEIMLDKLLSNLMKILIENGGAQKGYLILSNRGKLTIEAKGEVALDRVQVSQSLPDEISESLPVGMIQYVARTHEDIVLSEATKEGVFTTEPYTIKNQPKSVLCAPIINRGKLISILYLENNLIAGAFTPDRLELLKVLSAQAAISLENARLYQNLEDKVQQRTAQLAQANQEISTLNEMLKKDNIRMGAELDIVKQMQQMVLPKQSELEAIEGLEIAGLMEPADEVGGDYYDVLQQDGQVKISIGDVTGHGLESGVLMMMAQTAVRTLQKMNETDPVKFLDVINQTLYDNLQRMDSHKNMTLAILDYAKGVLKLSGQHEEMILVRADGKLECIDTMDLGFPIGLVEEISDFISQAEVQLNPGDVVVLYTDGIPEAFDINKAQYGLERLWKVVVENRQRSAEEIREAVIDDVRQYIGTQRVFDDITLVVMKQK